MMSTTQAMREVLKGVPNFWLYSQLNTGGYFDDNLPRRLWIQAETPGEANLRALAIGIYFDGVETGDDCECCGDRWDAAYGQPDDMRQSSRSDDEPVYMEDGEVWTSGRVIAILNTMENA